MRCPIREMHMHMIHAAPRKEVGEIQRIARALLCLGVRPVFALMLLDQIPRPFAVICRVALEALQNLLRRRVVNGRA
jgi:hypothetical protein